MEGIDIDEKLIKIDREMEKWSDEELIEYVIILQGKLFMAESILNKRGIDLNALCNV